MVRLYLDLETYRPVRERSFVEEKVIAVGLVRDETPYHQDSLKTVIEPVIHAEWNDLQEPDLIRKTFEAVEDARRDHRFTIVCGFNILGFDIPLMIAKANRFGIKAPEEASQLWHNLHTIDYFQQLLAANDNRFRGITLSNVIEVARQLRLEPPPNPGRGVDVATLYEQGNYDEIEEHLKRDLAANRWLDLLGAKRLIEKSVTMAAPLFQG